MSGKTKIEWATDQWNPVTGCSKVSQGCKHCYAEREWQRLAAPREKPNLYTGRAFTDVRCHPEKLEIPLRWTKPRRIFVNSMSDLFHEDVPDDFIDHVFAVMALCQQHVFQILTKRPERMQDYMRERVSSMEVNKRVAEQIGNYLHLSPCLGHLIDEVYYGESWPLPNVWLGVSCEDQATADERIPLLLQTPAAVRWVSAEPLLGPIYFDQWLWEHTKDEDGVKDSQPSEMINWIVVGGESGPYSRETHIEWCESIRDQCRAAAVPFFMKQLTNDTGRKIPIEKWPADLQIREYPNER